MKDGTEVLIGPIRPDDAEMEKEFIRRLSEDSAFNRFFGVPEELTPETIARFCNVGYEKEMALVAEMRDAPGRIIVGVARLAETTMRRGEFALVVADEFQRRCLGGELSSVMLEFARERGLASVCAAILPENKTTIALAKELGFRNVYEDNKLVIVEISL